MASEYPTPAAKGHFWALLVHDSDDDALSLNWEVVQVFENIMPPWCEADIESGECLMVFVPGRAAAKPLESFKWGPAVPEPEGLN